MVLVGIPPSRCLVIVTFLRDNGFLKLNFRIPISIKLRVLIDLFLLWSRYFYFEYLQVALNALVHA